MDRHAKKPGETLRDHYTQYVDYYSQEMAMLAVSPPFLSTTWISIDAEILGNLSFITAS